jgi:hypothetical protein
MAHTQYNRSGGAKVILKREFSISIPYITYACVMRAKGE